VEIGRDSDHRVGDLLAQVSLGVALELHQDARGDLLRGVFLSVDVDGPARAHLTLDRPDGPIGVGDGLALGDLTDEDFAVAGERDDRWRRARTLGVGDDGGLAALQDTDHRVGGSEVDTDRTCHGYLILPKGDRRYSPAAKLSELDSMMPRRSRSSSRG